MKSSTLKKGIYGIVTIFLLIVTWEIVAIVKNEPILFPSLSRIAVSFFRLFSVHNLNLMGMTLLRIVISVGIAFLIYFCIGTLYIWKKESYAFFRPVISIMRSTPLAILSIFLFILMGDKISPYVITILVILPVGIEGVLTAIRTIDSVLVDDLKLMNTNLFKSLFLVYIPLIKEYLVMTLLQTFGLGFKVMVMGEFICQTKNSIGKELFSIKSSLEMDNLIAWGILIVLVVFIVEKIVQGLIYNQKQKINQSTEKK